MRPIVIVSVLAAATALAGCEVPSAAERARLNALIGHPEVDLLRNYGVPSRTYGANGHTFLAYDSSYSTFDSEGFGPYGFGPFGGFGGFGYGGFGPGFGGGFSSGFAQNYTCSTTFEVDGGRVAAWSLHGDGCS